MFGLIATCLVAAAPLQAQAETVYIYGFADAVTDGKNIIVVSVVSAAPIEATSDALAAALSTRLATERPQRTLRATEARIFSTYKAAMEDRQALIDKATAAGTEIDLLASASGPSPVSESAAPGAGGTSATITADATAAQAGALASVWPFTTAEAKARQLAAAQTWGLPLEMKAAGRDFVLIPPGEFIMGSDASEPNRRKDETQHRVKIAEPFYLARDDEALPQNVDNSYSGVETWLANLQSQAPAGFAFRLPTEAEWEYAARAGKATPYYTGGAVYGAMHNGNQAGNGSTAIVGWGCPNSMPQYDDYKKCKIWKAASNKDIVEDFPEDQFEDGEKLPLVVHRYWSISEANFKHRQFQPNPWGLFDIYGSYRELTSDFYAPYPSAGRVTVNPRQGFGELRIVRGGSFRSKPEELRSAARQAVSPKRLASLGYSDTGIRLVLFKLPD